MLDEEEVSRTLSTLSAKIDELCKVLTEKKKQTEEKIREKPIAYVSGAFIGGLIVGYLLGRKE